MQGREARLGEQLGSWRCGRVATWPVQGREAHQSEQLGSWRYDENVTCEEPFRVRKHLVGRDASCGFPCSRSFYGEPLCERSRFVCPSVFERCEPPLMLIYGEFGTVA